MKFIRRVISKDNVVIAILILCLFLIVSLISHFDSPKQKQLAFQAACSKIRFPFSVQLDLSEASSIHTRGFELQVQHNSDFEVAFISGGKTTTRVSLLTLDAIVSNNATQMPFFTLRANADFGPVTAQTVNVTDMSVDAEGLSVSTEDSEIHVRLDIMAFELSEMGRLKIRELGGKEVVRSEVIGFDGRGEPLAVFLQSMLTNDATGQIFRASFPNSTTEMKLVRGDGPRSTDGQFKAAGCQTLSYVEVGVDGMHKPKTENSYVNVAYRDLELANVSLQGNALNISAVFHTTSVKVDGHELMRGRFESLLARPWYEQGALGLFVLFASMIFVEILKGTVKRIAAQAFVKKERD